jgi:hypothetical protein
MQNLTFAAAGRHRVIARMWGMQKLTRFAFSSASVSFCMPPRPAPGRAGVSVAGRALGGGSCGLGGGGWCGLPSSPTSSCCS